MINWGQVLFNSAVTGSLYLLAAVGLTLTYGLSKFPNFAHAEFMAFGAYAGYVVAEELHLGFQLSFLVAFLATAVLGAASYLLVFRPLSRRGASIIHLMVASIGLGFFVRHALQQIWGGAPLTFTVSWSCFDVGPVRITTLWLSLIGAALLMSVVMHLILTKTKVGKAIRASSSNPELALASGIDVEKIALITWMVGAALAGVGGLFRAADTRLVPLLGWEILLPAFAVVILGGIGSFYGALIAAYILGLAENLGVVLLVSLKLSTDYRLAIAFLILILTLIFKPSGFGKLFGEGIKPV
ncbi:branched-chain amino acid ABC transporter permease [Candidatus Bathyarchaeota archaeon]|nr:MAG: branched-chain amino acid ABC transporter permease [Candidatus Bathyarchaeota archaeon]